ncbi:MAG: Txe/YoeB family addiction module toxin [Lachnospiraceae bacterium]|jgi:addiction module toxin, txe/yoeB family|nr:Txe/YoeB family addiction module toxin [Lachnospiraceae bacterium]
MQVSQVQWDFDAWEDYLYWQNHDKKVLRQINKLVKDISRSPFEGLGKPEPLRENLSGLWSRRINKEHRLVYLVRENTVLIFSCRGHYDD